MQGQRSMVQSLTETFEIDHGSSSNNTARDLQLSWNNLLNDFNHDSGNLNSWNLDGSSSGDHTSNQPSNDEANIVSLESENINLNSNQAANEPWLLQNSNSDDIPQSQNLNSGFVANSGQVMEAGISPHPDKPGGSQTEQIPSPGGSTEGGDGRRLPCKRKAVEGVSEHPSLDGSSSSLQLAENNVWHATPVQHLSGVNGAGITSDYHHCSSSTAGDEENSHRNFRMRTNPPHQQDPATFNLRPSGNAIMRSHDWRPIYSPSRLLPFHPSLELGSTATIPSYPQRHSLVPHIPSFPASTVNPYPYFGGPNPHHSIVPHIPSLSSSPVIVGERPPSLQDEANTSSMLRRILEHPMSVPATVMRNLMEDPTHWSSVNGNISVPGNIASSSYIGSSSVVRPSPSSTWVPHPGPPGQYPRMLSANRNTSVPGNIAYSSRIGSSSVVHPSPGSTWVPNPGRPGQYLHRLPEVVRWPMFPTSETESPAQSNAFPPLHSVPGNIASSSRIGSSSVVHPSPGSTLVPNPGCPGQYLRRLPEVVRWPMFPTSETESPAQSNAFPPLHSADSTSSQEMVLPSGVGHLGNQGHPPYPRPSFWMDRQGDGVLGVPSSSRSLPAPVARGRPTVYEQIRSLLDLMQRGENLRVEDVLIVYRSVFYGAADAYDRHRDMRLDANNISYEEFLALEEQLGSVSTGLSEETVLKFLKQQKYVSIPVDASPEVEPCCVCQEEYVEGDELGKLDCGHDFHAACIKQWLMQKNVCPLCKTTALVTLD
ncbi:uncharacterized protein LOC143846842 [Tasmannia lanceolata]|uniref:uncharacterized protein LOC143846842 n=1 Tax=Tasmannia lanceolata TaxID=3420 RepID=UPI004063AA04